MAVIESRYKYLASVANSQLAVILVMHYRGRTPQQIKADPTKRPNPAQINHVCNQYQRPLVIVKIKALYLTPVLFFVFGLAATVQV